MRTMLLIIAGLTGCTALHGAARREPASTSSPESTAPSYVLLEYLDGRRGKLRLAREIDRRDARHIRLDRAFARPFLRWVLEVGATARGLALQRCGAARWECKKRHDHPAYFVLVKGGNRPRQGLAIVREGKTTELPQIWYTEIDLKEANRLIPHEYGHVMMFELLPGDPPYHPQTLPHTTPAITNDVVAFSEGWGIHFETLVADRREHPEVFASAHRDDFDSAHPSLHAARDLLNYAQSYRRYTCIKENCFAYLPRVDSRLAAEQAPTSDDLVARWTDATHDPARLRSLEQMASSEGVVAALFYRLATTPSPGGAGRPGDPPLPDPRRYRSFFAAISRLTKEKLERTPMVLAFLVELLRAADPSARRRIARTALEVLHYTPLLPDAHRIHAELHKAGHLLERDHFKATLERASRRMKRAVKRLVRTPELLSEAAAPEIWLQNDGAKLTLKIFGIVDKALVFDLNSAPVEFLMTVPGVGLKEAEAIDAYRRNHGGFKDVRELARVPGLPGASVEAAGQMQRSYLKKTRATR